MKQLTLAAFVIIVFSVMGCLESTDHAVSATDRTEAHSLSQAEIQEAEEIITNIIEKSYPANVRSGDGNQYGSVYSDSALWMPPNRESQIGSTDIGAAFGDRAQLFDIEPEIKVEEIHFEGRDFAYVIGKAYVVYKPKDGTEPIIKNLRPLWLLRNQSGAWKVVLQIWNEEPCMLKVTD